MLLNLAAVGSHVLSPLTETEEADALTTGRLGTGDRWRQSPGFQARKRSNHIPVPESPELSWPGLSLASVAWGVGGIYHLQLESFSSVPILSLLWESPPEKFFPDIL